MSEPSSATDLINHSYEDVALILGGFFAATPISDEAAWKLVGEVSHSWFRATARTRSHPTTSASSHELHPSVRAVLAAIRLGRERAPPA